MAQELEFKRQLQIKVYELLTGVVSGDTQNRIFFGQETIDKYWIPAFTHVTGNPEYKKNYEVFEYIGDRFVHAAFTMFIEKLSQLRGTNLDAEERTLLLNNYMSRDFQALKAKEWGLLKFLIASPDLEITPKIEGDMFESFFGALVSIADELIYPGMGYVFAFNLMDKIMKQTPIDFSKIQRPAITQLKEIHDILYSGKQAPEYQYTKSDLIGWSNKASVRDPNGAIIGVGYGNTQDEAQRNAAKDALNNLAKRGITKEILKEQQESKIRKDPLYDRQYQRVERAIEFLNSQPGTTKIGTFKLETQKVKTPKGDIFNYVLAVSYPHPDGVHQTWAELYSKVGEVGQTATSVRIALMKEFADKFNISA